MATLEDRILGEKLHYYCSSSEDEEEEEEEEEEEGGKREAPGGGEEVLPPPPERGGWEGSSTNTGPKGVLKDWQRFKQLEAERRMEQERERVLLAKKLAMSCRSHLDDEKEKEEKKKSEEEEEALLEEAFLRQYISKRMEEMMAKANKRATFGRLIHLESRDGFLDAIDKESEDVTVIIHIFEKGVPGCSAMTGCLGCVAQDYPYVKFCTLPASVAGVSANFKAGGCPALLVYRAGQLVGNFVRLTDEFSDDFYATDVESFLIEHGILVDRSLIPPGIRGPADGSDEDGDSDFSLDD